MPGTLMLDLSRMKRIIEVDEKLAYCLVEPGVGFFDLFDYLQQHNINCGCRYLRTPGAASSATPLIAA